MEHFDDFVALIENLVVASIQVRDENPGLHKRNLGIQEFFDFFLSRFE